MSEDYAMLFEKTVLKVFGKPKTPIYFAGYFDISGQIYKSILLTMCIYERNYNPEKYNDEGKEILTNYESKALASKNTMNDDIEFLKFLYEH